MSTPDRHAADPVPPIIAVGPAGTLFLSVDATVRDALAHLGDHTATPARPASSGADDPPPLPAGVVLFDRRGRQLHVDDTGPTPTLVVADPTDRRGELCARIEEQFANLRALAYRRPELLDAGIEPMRVRPPVPPEAPLAGSALPQPPDEDYDDFFATLRTRLTHLVPDDPTEHLGSWWHNLFHRYG